MVITIDEAEKFLIALKHCETCEEPDTNICKACPDYRRGSSAKCYDAIDKAIDTMRKYQEIQEIVTEWQKQNDPKIKFVASNCNMTKIAEVLEGNDKKTKSSDEP